MPALGGGQPWPPLAAGQPVAAQRGRAAVAASRAHSPGGSSRGGPPACNSATVPSWSTASMLVDVDHSPVAGCRARRRCLPCSPLDAAGWPARRPTPPARQPAPRPSTPAPAVRSPPSPGSRSRAGRPRPATAATSSATAGRASTAATRATGSSRATCAPSAFAARRAGCVVLSGRLADPYTSSTIDYARGGASEVDIDHVVALGDAWQKGAGAGRTASAWPSPTIR